MQKITISWMGEPKDVTTKFGVKQKFSIKSPQVQGGDVYVDVWSSPVTREWKVGQTVDVSEVATREWNGKTYYEVKMPKANQTASPEILGKLEEILRYMPKLSLGMSELLEWKRIQTGENKPKVVGTDLDYPPQTTENDASGSDAIPF